jgi:hypothetical protein
VRESEMGREEEKEKGEEKEEEEKEEEGWKQTWVSGRESLAPCIPCTTRQTN